MKVLDKGHIYSNGRHDIIRFAKFNDAGGGLEEVHGGFTNEEVIEILLDRLLYLNWALPCKENDWAMVKLQEALMWLELRTRRREAQGVESTFKPHV